MSWSLPKLPGYTFSDINQINHHVPQKIGYKNGIPIVKCDHRKVGGGFMDSKNSKFIDVTNDNEIDFSLTYGRPKDEMIPAPKPHWVRYDKKYLTFKGHFIHRLPDTPPEDVIIRYITIVYYLEDDTMEVIEPVVENSGFLQGRLVKRGKIYSDYTGDSWHWKDLNVGIDRNIGGLDLHISSCDGYTKAFMKSQGIELYPDEVENQSDEQKDGSDNEKVYKCGPVKRFLDDDGQVLQFDAIWDDTKSEYGELRNYKILFYPFDNSLAIKECHVINGGRDPFPMLLRRAKISKNWNKRSVNSTMFGDSSDADIEYYKAEDLKIGESIEVLGRNFYIFDCDSNTRSYYKNILNIEQASPVPYKNPVIKTYPLNVDPQGKEYPKDTPNSATLLRYVCDMISVYPTNKNRRFIMWYNLHDGTIRMDEVPSKDSGIPPLRFGEPVKVVLPGESHKCYSPEHFYIGAVIYVNNHKFRIVDADVSVYNYLKENPEKFPTVVVENVKNHHLKNRHMIFMNEEMSKKPDDDIFGNPPQDIAGPKPIELPAPLQGIECAMTMPERSEEKSESQPIVCLTGPIPDTHNDENVPQPSFQYDLEEPMEKLDKVVEMPMKKVSFQNVVEERN